jgi:hypothetical protein
MYVYLSYATENQIDAPFQGFLFYLTHWSSCSSQQPIQYRGH